MYNPANLEEAKRFEFICTRIVQLWDQQPELNRVQERIENTEYYQHVAHAEWLLATLEASDMLNRDLFMEKE